MGKIYFDVADVRYFEWLICNLFWIHSDSENLFVFHIILILSSNDWKLTNASLLKSGPIKFNSIDTYFTNKRFKLTSENKEAKQCKQ